MAVKDSHGDDLPSEMLAGNPNAKLHKMVSTSSPSNSQHRACNCKSATAVLPRLERSISYAIFAGINLKGIAASDTISIRWESGNANGKLLVSFQMERP
jgi:hypothetical protein